MISLLLIDAQGLPQLSWQTRVFCLHERLLEGGMGTAWAVSGRALSTWGSSIAPDSHVARLRRCPHELTAHSFDIAAMPLRLQNDLTAPRRDAMLRFKAATPNEKHVGNYIRAHRTLADRPYEGKVIPGFMAPLQSRALFLRALAGAALTERFSKPLALFSFKTLYIYIKRFSSVL